jgi:beta-lactamase class A
MLWPMRALLLLALLLAWPFPPAAAQGKTPATKRGPRHGLIHPLLDTEDYEFKELKPFEYKLVQLSERLKKDGKISVMALYFRDLDNGPAFGFDAQLPFQPASLLKLPLMMALLKAYEADPHILERTVAVKPAAKGDVEPVFAPSVRLSSGAEVTVHLLLTAMIGRSDNDAANTLLGAISVADYLRVYEDLGLRIPNVRDENDPVTVREYATFFRILYNASYLSKDKSQKALEYLAASEFASGLRGGVPKEVVVAHKFGESGREGGAERQFHDCGIIYHPRKPYVLCVMTRGRDMKTLAAAVAEASSLTWKSVDESTR